MAPELAAALVGGVSGLVGSGINAYGAYQDRKAAREAKKQANRQINSWEASANQILEDAMKNNVSLSSPEDLKAYQTLKSSYDPTRYIYDFDQFDKSSYNMEDYLNPAKDAIIADIGKAAQNTAAGAGLGHSSGFVQDLASQVADKSEQLYNDAYERMSNERNFDYGAYTDYITNMQNKLNQIQSGVLNQMNMYRGDIQFDQQQQDAMLANKLNLGNTLAQTRAQLV